MSEQYCIKCGAGLVAGARFCRLCGQPLADSQITSVTEGTTAIFPSSAEAPTQHFNQPTAEKPGTGPTFISRPGEGSPLVTYGPGRKRRGKVLLISSVFFIFLAFVSLAILGGILRRMNRRPPPSPTTPSLPSHPSVPPPPRAGMPEGASPLSELIYPGAKTEIDIRNNDDGDVLQLTTNDPFDKVVAWYETKLKPQERVIMPGQQAIFKSDSYQAIIRPEGPATKILLTQGDR